MSECRWLGELAASCTPLSTPASTLVPRCGLPLRLRSGLRSLACFRLRRLYLMELRSTRKPRRKYRSSGVFLLRNAERQKSEKPNQLPPRLTRNEPEDDPVGSVTEPLG
jgi:hypothetical protein